MRRDEIDALGELLSGHQVAMILGVCDDQVSRLARGGRIPAVKVGHVWRYPKRRLLEHLGIGEAA